MINCTYPKIKGGHLAIIVEDGKILVNKKFKELNDAKNWTNDWCDGYTYEKN